MKNIDISKCKYNYTSITNHSCCYAESERHVCMRKCKDFPNCYYRQLHQLKSENDELKKYIDRAGIIGIIKVLKCLDEIKEIVKEKCDSCTLDDYGYCNECNHIVIKNVRRKIKEVKENG